MKLQTSTHIFEISPSIKFLENFSTC